MRRLRLVRFNRNLLVFMIFLAISIAFWFMQSLQETKEVSIAYTLKVEDVPTRVIFTSDLPEQVNVNYTGKVWDALYHKFLANEQHEVVLKFKDIDNQDGKIVIDANAVRRAVVRMADKDMVYTSVTPNRIEVYYSHGQHKRVPVTFGGKISTATGRFLGETILMPDSVDVFAPSHMYDSIRSISTEKIIYTEVEDTIMARLALNAPRGVKLTPDSVKAKFCVDIYIDKTLQVPIYCANVPNNRIMRLFPLKTSVTFLVSATLYDEIKPDDFIIIADYSETSNDTKRCRLHVSQKPNNIRNLRISPEYVEYVIEQETE
ncbi:MAG: hypothetical protein J1F40_01235 [Prevotellaceae bacterium]|nr:hypothetical protein [Prevotellaceae bacterium]